MPPHQPFRPQPEGLQRAADADERAALRRFLRWQEFGHAVRVAVRRAELSARLDMTLRRGLP